MKRISAIMMMTMVLAIASTVALNAQRGMRGQMADTTLKRGPRNYMMQPGNMPPDSMRMFMRQNMGNMRMYGGMRQGPMHYPRQGYGFPPNMQWGRGPGFGRGFGPGGFGRQGFGRQGFAPQPPFRGRMESIPNLTEKQKKDISDLRQKNQLEMQKFREENLAKTKEIRDAHQKKLMDILTDEQKKYMQGNTQPAPQVKK